jgi:restriction system protein
MKKSSGPKFLRYCIPIINILKEFGGSGNPGDTTDKVISHFNLSEEEQAVVNKNGKSRVRNQIAWARFYLSKAGIIDPDTRGIWTLTSKGMTSVFSDNDILNLFKDVHGKFTRNKKPNVPEDVTDESDEIDVEDIPDENNHRSKVLSIIKAMTPAAFELLSKRILIESGFVSVEVTGKPGDNGIDGYGIVRLNHITSIKVIFQCKRYKESVGPSIVRDFRGAMAGRTDKGLILTTGYFTSEAKREATRDGAPPIDLIDGDELISLLEKLKLGLFQKITYDVDEGFFKQMSIK